MVETRRARKRQAEQLVENADDENNNDAAATLKTDDVAVKSKQRRLGGEPLEEEEETGKNDDTPAAAAAAAAAPQPHPPFELLSASAIRNIMSFFDNPRDVYNLSNCAKYIRACVTPEIVVRSAVFAGNKNGYKSRNVVERIKTVLQMKSIHIPSTLRLLRMVNATKCECGDQCYAYNLVSKTSGTNIHGRTYNAEAAPFGLMICYECTKGMSCPMTRRMLQRSFGSSNGRLEFTYGRRILRRPFTEAATGERAGSLLLAHHVTQIDTSYSTNEKKQKAFDHLLESIDQDESPEDSARAKAIVDAVTCAKSDYQAFVDAEKERIAKKRKEERAEKASKRKQKVLVAYEKLDSLLGDYEHKDLVLSCTWDEDGECCLSYKPTGSILRELLRAPSKATKKNIVAVIVRVRLVMDKIFADGFVQQSPNWCLGALSSRRERHVKLVVRYIKQLPPAKQEEVLNSKLISTELDHFVRSIEEDKPFEALLQLLIATADYSGEFKLDPQILSQAVKVHNANAARLHKLKLLIETIWRENFPRYSTETYNTEEKFKNKFELCIQDFKSLRSSTRAYLSDPPTIAFLQETTDAPGSVQAQRVSRQMAIDKMYTDRSCIQFLRSRDFESLLNRHRYMFRSPSHFR